MAGYSIVWRFGQPYEIAVENPEHRCRGGSPGGLDGPWSIPRPSPALTTGEHQVALGS
jgi:hypothetical protein